MVSTRIILPPVGGTLFGHVFGWMGFVVTALVPVYSIRQSWSSGLLPGKNPRTRNEARRSHPRPRGIGETWARAKGESSP
jgi:hypothetical protein